MVENVDLERIKKICRKVTILCVEDDFELRNQLVVLLSNFFNDIFVAIDGEEALDLYKEQGGFGIVLTDLNMPKMDGIELIKEIKKIDENQKVVVLTAHNEGSYLDELDRLKITSFMEKPVKLNDFIKVILNLVKE